MFAISVLIPCYNEEPYIEMAVDSVITQSFEDWELVIVDDGSDDGTSEILDYLLLKYCRYPINVITQPHLGCTAATKNAIECANSPLCTIFGGDDILDKDSLKVIVSYFKKHPELGFSWSKYHQRSDTETVWRGGRSKPLPKGKSLKDALLEGWWGALAQQSFRKSAYLQTTGLDPRIPYVMDQQVASLFAMANIPSWHMPIVTYYHLQHSKQMSAVHYGDQQACRRVILERMGGTYVREK